MRKSIFTVSAVIGLLAVTTSFSSTDVVEGLSKVRSEVSDKKVVKTYPVRYGLLSKSGTKLLSGSGFDLGGFVAKNTVTGEEYFSDRYHDRALPQFSEEDLPEGIYEFSGIQGQGGWVGYGTIVATVSDENLDADGYITIYVPITWEE